MPRRLLIGIVSLVLLTAPLTAARPAAAGSLADPAFDRVWARTDQPVAQGTIARTWFWGPTPLTGAMTERYLDAPGGQRLVQYFDKGRMELTDPSADPNSEWYVTSGLLTRELISGRIQIGTTTFINAAGGAAIPIAGDPDNQFPDYRDLAPLIDHAQPDRTGQFATTVLSPSGQTTRPDAAADAEVQFVNYVGYLGPLGTPVGYNVPRAFWNFMTQPGLIQTADGSSTMASPLYDWLFVLGYPLSDPFWVQVRVKGVQQWVLVQPFERRVLTYTPGNPAGWRVEMGNIGQHYLRWRYGATPAAMLNGDVGYFAFAPGNTFSFSTTSAADDTWTIGAPDHEFSGGSTLLPREEQGSRGHFITYWSVTPNGLDLYGQDRLDANGRLADSTVYSPPIHYLPGSELATGQEWTTSGTALSIQRPAYQFTVTVQVGDYQLVSTPAGYFPAWKLTVTELDTAGAPDSMRLTATVWFSPRIGVIQWINGGFAAQLFSASTVVPPS